MSAEELEEKKSGTRPPDPEKCVYDTWSRPSDNYDSSRKFDKSQKQQYLDYTQWENTVANKSGPSTSNWNSSNLSQMNNAVDGSNPQNHISDSDDSQYSEYPRKTISKKAAPTQTDYDSSDSPYPAKNLNRFSHFNNFGTMDKLSGKLENMGMEVSEPAHPIQSVNRFSNFNNFGTMDSSLQKKKTPKYTDYQSSSPDSDESSKFEMSDTSDESDTDEPEPVKNGKSKSRLDDPSTILENCMKMKIDIVGANYSNPEMLIIQEKVRKNEQKSRLDNCEASGPSATRLSSLRISRNTVGVTKPPAQRSIFANFCPTGPCRNPVPYKNTVPAVTMEEVLRKSKHQVPQQNSNSSNHTVDERIPVETHQKTLPKQDPKEIAEKPREIGMKLMMPGPPTHYGTDAENREAIHLIKMEKYLKSQLAEVRRQIKMNKLLQPLPPYKGAEPQQVWLPPPETLKNEIPVERTAYEQYVTPSYSTQNGSGPYRAKVSTREVPQGPSKQLHTPYVDHEKFWGPVSSSDTKSQEWVANPFYDPERKIEKTEKKMDKDEEFWNAYHYEKKNREDSRDLRDPAQDPRFSRETRDIRESRNQKVSTDSKGLAENRPLRIEPVQQVPKQTQQGKDTSPLQLAEQLQKQRLALAEKHQCEWERNAFSRFYSTGKAGKKVAKALTVAKVLRNYTHQEAIEFAAASWFWTGKPGPKLEVKDLKDQTPFPTFQDQDGVRAYYRVISERDEDYILIACHVNIHAFHRGDLRFVEVNDRTIVKGLDGKSPMGQMYLGDIVAVTELARLRDNKHLYEKDVKKISQETRCTWQVKTMTVLSRQCQDKLKFSFLSNGMGIGKGFDEAMDVLIRGRQQVVLDKLFIGSAFLPYKIDQFYCQNFEKKAKNSIVLMASDIPSYPNPSGTIYEFYEDHEANRIFEIGTEAFATRKSEWDTVGLHDCEMEGEGKIDREKIVETCVLMGYSAANAIFNGRFDCRAFPLEDARRDGNILRFQIENPSFQPTLGRWNMNNRINIVGPEGEASGTIESVIEASGTLKIVARLARGISRNIDFSSKYVVYQREPPENTVLRDDFFKIMDPKCNARRIIETLYGGQPIELDLENLSKLQFEFPGTPSISLNQFQNEYVSMILARTPMVLGSSPFGCGKSMTIVTAAFEIHKKNLEESMFVNERQQLLITQSNYASVNLIDIAKKANLISTSQDLESFKIPKFVRYVSEKCWRELSDNARTDYDMPKLMEKVFVEWAKGEFEEGKRLKHLNNHHFLAMLNFVLDHNLLNPMEISGSALSLYRKHYSPEQKSQKPKSSPRELLDSFFTLYQPDIIMVTADSSLSLLQYRILKDVVTIQIDEASQLPEYTLFSLLVSFPNACFGLIGDIHQLPPFCVEELSGKLKDYGIGNTMERSVRGTLFPKSILRYVYRCHPKTTALLSELFYDSELISGVTEDQRNEFMRNAPRTFWPNPDYPMIIVDNQEPGYRMGTSCGNHGEVLIVKQIIDFITSQELMPARDIGVISFYGAQTSVLTEALRGSGVKCGTVDAFQGSEREVIILCCTNERLSDFMQLSNRLNVAMSRARQATIVIGSVRGLRVAKYWSTVVQRVDENRNMVDTKTYPFRGTNSF